MSSSSDANSKVILEQLPRPLTTSLEHYCFNKILFKICFATSHLCNTIIPAFFIVNTKY